MRWLGGILGRPLALETGDGSPRIVLVERRRAADADHRASVALLCEELRARLLGQYPDSAAQVMRELVLVHDQLTTKGWSAVEALSSSVLGMAVVQAQALTSSEPSPALAQFADRLRVVKVNVELREERQRMTAAEAPVEVRELTHEEFVRSEQDWQASQMQPDSLPPPQR